MKIKKLLSTLLLSGTVVFGATSCGSSNEISLDEANKKLEKATEKTQQKLQEQLEKEVLYFDAFFNYEYKLDMTAEQGLITRDPDTNKITEKDVEKLESLNVDKLSMELYGNFDTNYYKNLDTKLPTDNRTELFAALTTSTKVKGSEGISIDKTSKMALDYKQNTLRGVGNEDPNNVMVLPVEEDIDETIGLYLNAAIEALSAPKEETPQMSIEDMLLEFANSTGDDDLIAMVYYLVEEYDFENLTSEDIIEIIVSLLGESEFISPTLKAYLVACLEEIKTIKTNKIIEAKTESKKKYDFVIYSLNYKELKIYLNKVLKVFKDKLETLSGEDKLSMTMLVTYAEESVKEMLPDDIKLSLGFGMKDGAVMALSLDASIKGIENVSETPSILAPNSYYYTSSTINELSLSVDFGYDFATKAYSIPSLDAYFA